MPLSSGSVGSTPVRLPEVRPTLDGGGGGSDTTLDPPAVPAKRDLVGGPDDDPETLLVLGLAPDSAAVWGVTLVVRSRADPRIGETPKSGAMLKEVGSIGDDWSE